MSLICRLEAVRALSHGLQEEWRMASASRGSIAEQLGVLASDEDKLMDVPIQIDETMGSQVELWHRAPQGKECVGRILLEARIV